jgi:hypothetical protein
MLSFEQLEKRLAMASVVSNELLADSSTGLVDQDNEHSDWIELSRESSLRCDAGSRER